MQCSQSDLLDFFRLGSIISILIGLLKRILNVKQEDAWMVKKYSVKGNNGDDISNVYPNQDFSWKSGRGELANSTFWHVKTVLCDFFPFLILIGQPILRERSSKFPEVIAICYYGQIVCLFGVRYL